MDTLTNAPVFRLGHDRRTDLPVHALIAGRYSPRAFRAEAVTEEELTLLLEAARLSPSGSNEQPWRFLVARRDEERFDRIVQTLAPQNQLWAAHAPVLMVAATERFHSRTGNPYAYGRFDLGLALGALTVQATALGIGVHPMGGFDAEQLRAAFAIRDTLDIVVVTAIGRPGTADQLPESFREREGTRTARRPLGDLMMEESSEKLY